MKQGFYLKLALDGMRKNKRLYLPYLLTCAGMVMMFYILSSLSYSPLMETMRGGSIMSMILNLGTFVMALFSLLFLLYTNAFLSRRRNKEFGLYNILGMNKANLSRILLWETLLSALFALVIGLAGGILFSKLTELFLLHMAGEQVGYALSVEPKSIAASAVFFGAIFALILVLSVARVGIFKPLDLLKSETAGEKPPKANWLLALAGVIILGLAYYIAVKIDEPLTAIMMFFAAVLMVIAATYLLFIAGSVVMCRLLQKNKRYYYQPAHFVSVSSMAFRMRRNGAGLASICILATMVLVMLSSTSCLYFGGDDALHSAHPYDMQLEVDYKSPAACTDEARERLNAVARDVAQGREDGLLSYTLLDTAGYFESGTLDVDGVARRVDVSTPASLLERLRTVYVLPLSDYNRLAGAELSLSLGEALIWSSGAPYADDTFAIKGSRTLRVRDTLTELPSSSRLTIRSRRPTACLCRTGRTMRRRSQITSKASMKSRSPPARRSVAALICRASMKRSSLPSSRSSSRACRTCQAPRRTRCGPTWAWRAARRRAATSSVCTAAFFFSASFFPSWSLPRRRSLSTTSSSPRATRTRAASTSCRRSA